MIHRATVGLRTLFNAKTRVYGFAKEAAPKKDGKKDDKAAEPAAVVQQVPLTDLAVKWISPKHASLSPSQLKYYNQGFEDLSQTDKDILNNLADKLLSQPTAIFYDALLKKGVLGTSELFYTAVDELPEKEISESVRAIRKEL